MPFDRVVLNASPLICLSKADLLAILPALFEDIVVPEAVIREVAVDAEPTVTTQHWMHRIIGIPLRAEVSAWDLGQGESAVLSFALQNTGYRAVIDDREARRCAASLNVPHLGTAGCILLAKK